MNPERWKQIDKIFDEVLEISEAKREDFLSERCANDENLKLEVLSLLNAHKKADFFIEDAAIKLVGEQFADVNEFNETEIIIGKKLGSYKIEKLIGEGGMGEVYLAHDQKLKRKIALKILPPQYTSNDERVQRLTREARAISSLNHPNIVTIHDVGKTESTNYIATEYVEGKTLRDFINDDLSLEETLKIIIQCCEALAAAHNTGIIHRDIKPENIMIRPDGYVKILDFGLAKLTETKKTDSIKLAETLKGTIMGTPAYMSPEQASGELVDNRTDLWSIGVVLYEMLTGKNPFKRESRQSTIQAILSNTPKPPISLNPQIPTELNQILIKALEKEQDLSYQTASDLIVDLKRVKRKIYSTLEVKKPKNFNQNNDAPSFTNSLYFTSIIFLSLILIGSAIGYFFFYNNPQQQKLDWTRAKNVQLTSQAGTEYYPTLSPDGKSFVFSAKTQDNYDIFLRRVGGKNPINLTPNSSEKDTQPAFSPDGKFIAFRSDREPSGIYVMEQTGENQRRISDFGFHPSWSPDGQQIVVSERGFDRPLTRTKSSLWIVNISTGEKRKLTEAGNLSYQPNWSPNGKRIAFWMIQEGGRRDIATISLKDEKPKMVTKTATTNWNPVWSPDGKYLYFSSDRGGNMAFWRIQTDESTGETLGEPEIVPTPAKFNSHISFSRNGKRLIYVQSINQSNLKGVEFDAKEEKTIGQSFWITKGDYLISGPELSPDGNQFVVRLVKKTQEDIVLMNRDGKNWRDLTNDVYFDRYTRWSPDGKNVAFTSDRNGNYEIWTIGIDGTNLRQLTFDSKGTTTFPIWSPDGKYLSYNIPNKTFILDLSKRWNEDNPQMLPLNMDLLFLGFWDWSPDGMKLLGSYRDNDDFIGILYYSFETKKYEKITKGIRGIPHWLADSHRFVFGAQGKAYICDIKEKKAKEILSIPNEVINQVSISNDDRLLYFTVTSTESDIWLLDLE